MDDQEERTFRTAAVQFLQNVRLGDRSEPQHLAMPFVAGLTASASPVAQCAKRAIQPAAVRHKSMDQIEASAKALRDALTQYGALEQHGTGRVAVAQSLFGVPATRLLLPLLDELAHSVQPASKRSPA